MREAAVNLPARVGLEMGLIGKPGGLDFGDDPGLHRKIKAELRKKKNDPISKVIGLFVNKYPDIPPKLIISLAREINLSRTDIFEGEELEFAASNLLENLQDLDFRNLDPEDKKSAIIYDSEVVTPQAAWLVAQLFKDPSVGFSFIEKNYADHEDKKGIVRNLFILAYLFGYLDENTKEGQDAILFLAYYQRKDVLYPKFLRKFLEGDDDELSSERLKKLKQYWPSFAKKWFLMARDVSSHASADDISNQKRIRTELQLTHPERRPFENLSQANKRDIQDLEFNIARGARITHFGRANEQTQLLAELDLKKTIVGYREAEMNLVGEFIKLYRDDPEARFNNRTKVADNWVVFKAKSSALLNIFAKDGRASKLKDAKNDPEKLKEIFSSMVQEMIEIIQMGSEKNSLNAEELFGDEFFQLATVEQLSLIIFTTLSLISEPGKVVKKAVTLIDEYLIPFLNNHIDNDLVNNLASEENEENFDPFDPDDHEREVLLGKENLEQLRVDDGLVSIDNPEFKRILNDKKKILKGLSSIHSAPSNVWEILFPEKSPRLRPAIITALFLIATGASGYFNYQLVMDNINELLEVIDRKNLESAVLIFRSLAFGSGFFAMNNLSKKRFREFSLFSSNSGKNFEINKKGYLHWGLLIVLFAIYLTGSNYPRIEPWVQDRIEDAQDFWEAWKNKENENVATGWEQYSAWEDRNPEEQSPEELRKIKKTTWGDIVVGGSGDLDGGEPVGMGFMPISEISVFISDGDIVFEPVDIPHSGSERITTELIQATSVEDEAGELKFTLPDGRILTQSELGADYVVHYESFKGNRVFPFFGNGATVEKIITVTPGVVDNGVGVVGYSSYSSSEIGTGSDIYVVYRTNPGEDQADFDLDQAAELWRMTAEDRPEILRILQEKNPKAASMYEEMINDFALFWLDNDGSDSPSRDTEYNRLVAKHAEAYRVYVETNHLYSLKYSTDEELLIQHPMYAVMLQVMSSPDSKYYCQTAHLSAQQWFLSSGVAVDGKHGYGMNEVDGQMMSRIGHVVSGFGGIDIDMTPIKMNPGEDFSALEFSLNKKEEVGFMKENSAGFLLLSMLALSTYGVNMSFNHLKGRFKSKTKTEEMNEFFKEVLPDDEKQLRGLVSAMTTLLTYAGMSHQPTDFEQEQLGAATFIDEANFHGDLVTDALISSVNYDENSPMPDRSFREVHSNAYYLVDDVIDSSWLSNLDDEVMERLFNTLRGNKESAIEVLRSVLSWLDEGTYQATTLFVQRSEKIEEKIMKLDRKTSEELRNLREQNDQAEFKLKKSELGSARLSSLERRKKVLQEELANILSKIKQIKQNSESLGKILQTMISSNFRENQVVSEAQPFH